MYHETPQKNQARQALPQGSHPARQGEHEAAVGAGSDLAMTLTVTFDEEEAEQITDFKSENNIATDEDAVRRLVLLGLATDLKAWHEKLK